MNEVKLDTQQATAKSKQATRLITFAVILAIIVGWHSSWLYPLKMLTVFFHELSHALMTVATGGKVVSFELDPRQGGAVMSAGGSRFWTLTAGYLGSLLWGVVLFWFADRTRLDRYATGALALLMLVVILLFSPNQFALIFCLVVGAVLALLAIKGSHWLNDLVLRLIGISCMMYVPLDIISDTIVRSHLRSDAAMLAEEFGGATIFWGIIWLAISVVVGVWMLIKVWKSK
ncbi:M50 family metallopeptidase [Endozoicomonas sp. SM1973]|uniref:M50 family metallopeptidase n=1 Tax=Spartinivicinus marinus TaxID=2994442 RepID=A0A853HTG9_9GAMM|nr:M50 family metallopeptidase [Spartinivicinus marinus]MCX4029486.1 M50 family metallopeptidase [Spartinivicinus marinus]NYZ65060.1 M50 family metallopeptidase [Spartinivicinus marinus]